MQKIFLIFNLVLFCNIYIFSQDNKSVSFVFQHVALSVKNVDVSADFYKKVLHLKEITNRSKAAGIRWFSLNENKELHLISTVKEKVIINKAVHFALATSDFDGLLKDIKEMQIPYWSWQGDSSTVTTRADGIKQIYIKDPDGYWIEINSEKQ